MRETDVNFLDLDLNLLIALDALLAERSVTKAAERLGRSQPALSASLKRLRRQFRDDLLTRVGNSYELTPLAAQLHGRLSLVLSDIDRVFGMRARFEPEHSDREFVVVTSDYGLSVLGAELARIVASEAPSLRLRFIPVSERFVEAAHEALRAVDGMLLPHGFLRGLPHLDVYRDRYVCLVDHDHPSAGGLSEADLARYPWVLAFHRPSANLPAVRQLQMMGIQMEVAVALDTFLAIPEFIVGTDRIAMMQEKLAHRVVSSGEVKIVPCPVELMPLVEAFWWHPTVERDPGHIWFRSLVNRVGGTLASLDSPSAR